MMSKKVIFSIFVVGAVLFSVDGFSQSVEQFTARLALPDSTYHSKVTIVEHSDAANAIRIMQQHKQADDKIRGYRVRIFFDNSQNARALATSTLSRFKEFFPEIPVYMNYENPYFKVTVGNCISAEEAITLWGKVKNSFDRAFVVRETVQISTLSE